MLLGYNKEDSTKKNRKLSVSVTEVHYFTLRYITVLEVTVTIEVNCIALHFIVVLLYECKTLYVIKSV